MSTRAATMVRCDAPDCAAAFEVAGSTADNRNLPPKWWSGGRSFRLLHACPDHAAEARRWERAVHEHERQECAVRNRWMKAHPGPAVPKWLEKLT